MAIISQVQVITTGNICSFGGVKSGIKIIDDFCDAVSVL